MPRVKRGTVRRAKRKKLLGLAKGYYANKSKLYRAAKESVDTALKYAFVGRRNKKREMRALWIVRINAAARLIGTSYSRLMGDLKKRGVILDLAHASPRTFDGVLEEAPDDRAHRDPFPLRPPARDAARHLGHQSDPDPGGADALRRAERPGREPGLDVRRHPGPRLPTCSDLAREPRWTGSRAWPAARPGNCSRFEAGSRAPAGPNGRRRDCGSPFSRPRRGRDLRWPA